MPNSDIHGIVDRKLETLKESMGSGADWQYNIDENCGCGAKIFFVFYCPGWNMLTIDKHRRVKKLFEDEVEDGTFHAISMSFKSGPLASVENVRVRG